MDTVKTYNSKISLEILNTKTNVKLKLELFAIEGNVARLKIDEADSTKKRYEIPIGDCLIGEPQPGV